MRHFEFLRQFFEEGLKTVRQMEEKGRPIPHFFEFLFGMADLPSQSRRRSIAGHRQGLRQTDATNVVKDPVLTVLTSIGMDHTEYLGEYNGTDCV